MTTFYEVWDDDSGNRLGQVATRAEAEAVLEDVLRESGADAVLDLAILAYADGEKPRTILEGSEYVERVAVEA